MLERLKRLLGFGMLLASGCSFTQVGRLYQISSGQSSEMQTYDPMFQRGSVLAHLPDGSSCRGGFRTIDPQKAREMTKSEILFSDNADASVAVLRCSSGAVLRCAFAGRPNSGFSYGTCRDQRDVEYAVIF